MTRMGLGNWFSGKGLISRDNGEVAEWFMALASKARTASNTVMGSNPILSSSMNKRKTIKFSEILDTIPSWVKNTPGGFEESLLIIGDYTPEPKQKMHRADVVISNGSVVKYRWGQTPLDLDMEGKILIWEEKPGFN